MTKKPRALVEGSQGFSFVETQVGYPHTKLPYSEAGRTTPCQGLFTTGVRYPPTNLNLRHVGRLCSLLALSDFEFHDVAFRQRLEA